MINDMHKIEIYRSLKDLINEWYWVDKPVEIIIHNTKRLSNLSSCRDLAGLDINSAKYELSKRAQVRRILFGPRFNSIIMETFTIDEPDFGIFCFDYELLYGDKEYEDLEIGYLYQTNLFNGYNPYICHFNRKSKDAKLKNLKNPLVVLKSDIDNIHKIEYNGFDLIYGYRGHILANGGYGATTFEFYDEYRIIPINYIKEYTKSRPKIEGVNRYKVYTNLDWDTYSDSENEEEAIEEVCSTNFIDRSMVHGTELVPDGKWII